VYESQVIQAMVDTAAQCSLTIPFFVLLADRMASGYEFYFEPGGDIVPDIEKLVLLLDENLARKNEEYKQKRASGRLKPLRAWRLKPGTAMCFRAHFVQCGQREGQFKMQCLAYKDEVGFDFQPQLATS
jgi:hypothetical protein